MRWIVGILGLLLSGCTQPQTKPERPTSSNVLHHSGFTYTAAGLLYPRNSGVGRVGDGYIYAKGIRFPIEYPPAYINSQVYGIGGLYGPRGSLCDPRNFQYPWHDNYCEKRGWGMPLCPTGKGHQGVDIRPASCAKRRYYAVAVERGVITSIGKYTVKLRGDSGRTYRYMHLDSGTLRVHRGSRVRRGERIGLVSDNMGKTKTSVHLHFDIQQTIVIDGVPKRLYVPPYTSLIDAYRRLLAGRP